MASILPDETRFQAFVQRAGDAGPIVMINLLRYRDAATYPAGFEATPCNGREAYMRYGAVASQTVAKVGGKMLWAGSVHSALIAPAGEQWDDAVLVQYPSRKAFLEMLALPEYQAAVTHRSAALADSRLVETETQGGALGAPSGDGS